MNRIKAIVKLLHLLGAQRATRLHILRGGLIPSNKQVDISLWQSTINLRINRCALLNRRLIIFGLLGIDKRLHLRLVAFNFSATILFDFLLVPGGVLD